MAPVIKPTQMLTIKTFQNPAKITGNIVPLLRHFRRSTRVPPSTDSVQAIGRESGADDAATGVDRPRTCTR
jgi:hypothetical protein